MRKNLLIASILFLSTQTLQSEETNDKNPKNLLQCINQGCDALQALHGKTPIKVDPTQPRTYSKAELTLGNDYLSSIIQPYLSRETPDLTQIPRRKRKYSYNAIEDNQIRCVEAIERNNFIACKTSIEMLNLCSAQFSCDKKKRNFIESFRDGKHKNFAHYASMKKTSTKKENQSYKKIKNLIFQELHASNVDMHHKDFYLRTPMHTAAEHNCCCAIESLYKFGAKVNVQDNSGKTPMHQACLNHADDAIISLHKLGAEVDAEDDEKRTPMHHSAMQIKSEKTLKLLHSIDGNINAQDKFGKTPTHLAAESNNFAAVKMLLSLNADITILNREDKTAEQITHDQKIKDLFAADRADRQKIQENRAKVIQELKTKLKYCRPKRKNSCLEEESQSSCKKQKHDKSKI